MTRVLMGQTQEKIKLKNDLEEKTTGDHLKSLVVDECGTA